MTANESAEPAGGRAESSAASALLTTAALQGAIASNIIFWSIATDQRGLIQVFNAGAERMLGYSPDEVVNKVTLSDVSDPDELLTRAQAMSIEFRMPVALGFDAMVCKAARGAEDVYELTAIRKDGSRLPAVVSVTALRDPEKAIIGYLFFGTDNTNGRGMFATARDVTELKRFENELQRKNVELEDASRMKSDFLAKMSHELRTPLNAIIGFSEVLRDGLAGEMTEKQRGFIGDIFSSGQHLLSVINDILDLSRVEAGKMTLELDPVEVASLFGNTVAIVRERAAAHRVRLSIDVSPDLESIRADARKVKQIVYNLLSNAVKFTTDGGTVTLQASRVARADVGRLSGTRPGRAFPLAESEFDEFMRISVTDSGIGISPDGLEGIFQPFSQIDSSLAREFGGTGLGLVIVKSLAELHGGTITVESAVGSGSCFTVWLPLRGPEGTPTVPAPPRVHAEALGGQRTALVVEDDFKSANLIRVQLEAEGFHVLHAASAEAALVLALQQPLSLITLDVRLPNMDGWELLGRLKRVPGLQNVPVVVISITADHKKGIALGASAVMQKPMSRRELYDSLVDLGLFPLAKNRALKVLVVDDDPDAIELIASRIVEVSRSVLRANGGREAIDAARKELPDLIVLDLLMPDLNGFDVLEALKNDASTAVIPVLIVTAKPVTARDHALLDRNVVAILQKGELDRDHFIAEVRRATAQPRTAA